MSFVMIENSVGLLGILLREGTLENFYPLNYKLWLIYPIKVC